MSLAAALIPELEHEAVATRRLLERVPDDQLEYRPHAKSMSLGQLAHHTASIPGSISQMAAAEGIDVLAVDFTSPSPASAAELVQTLDGAIEKAKAYLSGLDDAGAAGIFTARAGEKVLFAMPKIALLRNLMLNHWYHHRGQLTVYLRLLDVPLPSVYGPSADENPFK